MKIRKKIALGLAISMFATALPSVPSVAVDTQNRYEFEDGVFHKCEEGVLTWTQIDEDAEGNPCDMTGWSGDGYGYIDQKGASITVTVNVEKTGLYEVLINYIQCYGTPHKIQYLNVNGANQGEVRFPFNSGNGWEKISAGYVMLNKGDNTIEIESYWGYTFLDYLEVKEAPAYLTDLSPTTQLSNPNASEHTKSMYEYLMDCYGNHILAGQQERNGSHCYASNSYESQGITDFSYLVDNEGEFEYIYDLTGEYPAVRGIDMLTYNATTTYRDDATKRIIEWYDKKNGIPTVTWHWCVPSEENGTEANFYVESANPNFTTFSITNALKEDTWEHKVILNDITVLAEEFQKIQDADVPFIFRPLHEAQGAWFWWGAEGPEACVELYRLLYDQLTNVYGLNNIIWEWTSSTFNDSYLWYPGNDVVDLIGYDKYNAQDYQANLSAISATFYSLVGSTEGEKMVCMSENDTIPSLENLQNEKAKWLYFCPWYGNYMTDTALNPADNVKEIYQSEYCITLSEVPDLKTYHSEKASQTTTAKTTTTTAKATTTTVKNADANLLYGDVNCDGSITIADITLYNKVLADQAVFSTQGATNADVDFDQNRTAKDATKILKYLAGMIDYDALSKA